MITVILLGVLSVLFSYIAKYKTFQGGLKISFLLIFIFLALRYNYGNDYNHYLNGFIEINRIDKLDFHSEIYQFEPGWVLLNRLFRPFGFFAMIMFLALINCAIYYHFIKKYVPVKYYWFALFLYIFNPTFMLTHSSAMRQSLSIALFVFSIDYIYKKDAIRYFIIISLSSLIHSSAIILFSVYLLAFVNWKIKNITIAIFISIYISLFIFIKSIIPVTYQLISSYFVKYEPYLIDGTIGSGIGVFYYSLLLLLVLYYAKFQNKETTIIFKIAIISFIFIPLYLQIQLIGRIGMYFLTATIITYPIILVKLRKLQYKAIFLTIIVLMTTYQFYSFFNSETWSDAFRNYQTIFSAPKWL